MCWVSSAFPDRGREECSEDLHGVLRSAFPWKPLRCKRREHLYSPNWGEGSSCGPSGAQLPAPFLARVLLWDLVIVHSDTVTVMSPEAAPGHSTGSSASALGTQQPARSPEGQPQPQARKRPGRFRGHTGGCAPVTGLLASPPPQVLMRIVTPRSQGLGGPARGPSLRSATRPSGPSAPWGGGNLLLPRPGPQGEPRGLCHPLRCCCWDPGLWAVSRVHSRSFCSVSPPPPPPGGAPALAARPSPGPAPQTRAGRGPGGSRLQASPRRELVAAQAAPGS